MTTTITTEKVSEDQIWLKLDEIVVAMLAHLDGGGWLWLVIQPFCTGIEVDKESAGNKAMHVLAQYP